MPHPLHNRSNKAHRIADVVGHLILIFHRLWNRLSFRILV